jgi:hypothetical protein
MVAGPSTSYPRCPVTLNFIVGGLAQDVPFGENSSSSLG